MGYGKKKSDVGPGGGGGLVLTHKRSFSLEDRGILSVLLLGGRVKLKAQSRTELKVQS
jgi:hypothetical protein